jgi:hypothetical protein
MDTHDIVQLAMFFASVGGIVLTIIWRTGTLSWRLGSMENNQLSVKEWLKDITEGKCPVGAKHDATLEAHSERLDNHEHRIGKLEEHDGVPSHRK